MLNIARRVVDLDRNVIKVLVFRLWTIVAGALTIVFVPRFLSVELQGYYYTFLSIVMLQALFDLGLSQTVSQIASHEFAHVDWRGLAAKNDDARVSKLAFIKVTISRWYYRVSTLFVLVVSGGGALYFSLFDGRDNVTWLGPWLALVAITGINLNLSPRLAMVEGAGLIGAVAQLRLVQSVCGYLLLFVGLASGAGLWSVTAVPAASAVTSLIWLRSGDNPFRAVPAFVAGIHDHAPWRAEILGLQWRVAIAWLGGYFASQVVVPLTFAMRGADAAGRVGLGLQIFTAVQALGMSWISARIPRFGQLIARGDGVKLKSEFTRAQVTAVAATGVGCLIVVIALELIPRVAIVPVNRLPSPLTATLLALVATMGTAIYGFAAYMRAYKEEPLVLSSLVIGAATLLGAGVGGRLGADYIILAYALVTACINLPWTILIFRTYYHRHVGLEVGSEQRHVA